ncbi:hypothetical protein KIN20_018718 [Parelaphostrongylus tenuis]|uniref:Uncharacterized protein n=1 Tax=Parelaphostrongylus tenuis TaxID=148309 RepID=A0AAD5N414_PARTN|nr:hypothetical protein KIN20_018718 [Parelaphostrongylus tenuis]
MMKENCIIVDNTVTSICTQPMMQQAQQNMCDKLVAAIPPQHLTIGGAISVRTAFFCTNVTLTSERSLCRPQTLSLRIGRDPCGKV